MIRIQYYLLLAFFTISIPSKAEIFIPAGNVSGTWTLSNSPYKIQGNITVANGTTLTIEPGVVVEFQGKYRLFCNGRILAIGTTAQWITFTTTASNTTLGWLGIRFDDTPSANDASYFKYCTVRYGKADQTIENTGGAFYFNNFSKCTIDNCFITGNYARDGGSALSCINASPLIKDCTFSGNSTYQGGNCAQFIASNSIIDGNTFAGGGIDATNSNLTIRNNHISGNAQCGIWSYSTNQAEINHLEITNNIIENNVSDNGSGGGGINIFCGAARIEHNIIRNNGTGYCGGGITCWNFTFNDNISDTVISNNLIYGNSSGQLSNGLSTGGGAIFCSNSSPTIINNTIYNNSSFYPGGAIKCVSNSDPYVYNNIIWNNTVGTEIQNIFLNENNCDPNFLNNCLQQGLGGINANGYEFTGEFADNFDAAPLFTNVAAQDFSLTENSPCVNTGLASGLTSLIPSLDLAGNPRQSGASIDVGAYEFQEELNIDPHHLQSSIFCYPNPAGGILFLSQDIDSIALFSSNGQTLQPDFNGSRQLNVAALQAGIYFLSVTKGNQVANIRFIKK